MTTPTVAPEGVFGDVYAGAYDAFYAEKDYEGEVDLLEQVFATYAAGPVRSVADLGCGTGNHAIPLARRGFEIVGLDRSAQMLGQARAKADAAGLSPRFQQGDVRSFDLGATVDAAAMMFAVLGYQVSNADVLSTLRSVRRHLAPGGVFFFDVWYGPAVLMDPPGQRVKTIPMPDGGEVLRAAYGRLDTAQQTCTVDYDVWRLAGDSVLARDHESHTMRYFFPLELELFLETTGFELVRLGGFPDFGSEPGDRTWTVAAVARAV